MPVELLLIYTSHRDIRVRQEGVFQKAKASKATGGDVSVQLFSLLSGAFYCLSLSKQQSIW